MWVDELNKHAHIKTLRRSQFYKEHHAELTRLLNNTELNSAGIAKPLIADFIRVVGWNIEKGKNFNGVVNALSTHPILKHGDLILLNEVDVGMNRSGNLHIARELAQALQMYYAFAPAHLELTKGTGDELNLPGENTVALQGNAILSRYPLSNPRIIDLPVCWEAFNIAEKRYGRRIALLVDVSLRETKMTIITTHLEVRETPACRAKQMATIMEAVIKNKIEGPILIAGDFNCHTFRRGSRWRSYTSLLRILLSSTERLNQQLLHPESCGEGLFQVLKRSGFSYSEFNDEQPTSYASMKGIEDSIKLPGFLSKKALAKLERRDHKLDLKLDWMTGREIRALSNQDVCDSSSHVCSLGPRTIKNLRFEGKEISDHDPIMADIQPRI